MSDASRSEAAARIVSGIASACSQAASLLPNYLACPAPAASVDSGGDGDYACNHSDPRGRIRREAGHLVTKTGPQRDLSDEVLAQLGACSSDGAALLTCPGSSANVNGGALIREVYSLNGSTTATTVTTTTLLPGTACGDTFPQCDGGISPIGGQLCMDNCSRSEKESRRLPPRGDQGGKDMDAVRSARVRQMRRRTDSTMRTNAPSAPRCHGLSRAIRGGAPAKRLNNAASA